MNPNANQLRTVSLPEGFRCYAVAVKRGDQYAYRMTVADKNGTMLYRHFALFWDHEDADFFLRGRVELAKCINPRYWTDAQGNNIRRNVSPIQFEFTPRASTGKGQAYYDTWFRNDNS